MEALVVTVEQSRSRTEASKIETKKRLRESGDSVRSGFLEKVPFMFLPDFPLLSSSAESLNSFQQELFPFAPLRRSQTETT